MTDEDRLLATLRANPADAETREVYADSLEQTGDVARAAFVRTAKPAAGDPEWRRAISCGAIERCGKPECPRSWALLAKLEDPSARRCACERNVVYCSTVEELMWARGGPVVFDPAIPEQSRHIGDWGFSGDIDIRPLITRYASIRSAVRGPQQGRLPPSVVPAPRRTLRQRLGDWLTARRSR